MIDCWSCANKPLVWQQVWVWSHSLSVLNKFYEYSLANSRDFPQTAISRSMTSPMSSVIRSGPVFLKWLITVPSSTRLRRALWSLRNFFGFQFGRWRLRVIYVVLFVWARDAGIFKLLNRTEYQWLWEPNNVLLFLLVLWPNDHPCKLDIMLLLCVKKLITFDTVPQMHSKSNASHPLAVHCSPVAVSFFQSVSFPTFR